MLSYSATVINIIVDYSVTNRQCFSTSSSFECIRHFNLKKFIFYSNNCFAKFIIEEGIMKALFPGCFAKVSLWKMASSLAQPSRLFRKSIMENEIMPSLAPLWNSWAGCFAKLSYLAQLLTDAAEQVVSGTYHRRWHHAYSQPRLSLWPTVGGQVVSRMYYERWHHDMPSPTYGLIGQVVS